MSGRRRAAHASRQKTHSIASSAHLGGKHRNNAHIERRARRQRRWRVRKITPGLARTSNIAVVVTR